ncbi:DGAT1/2-independent enzyme synthesizing storage lipids isoform X2 [Tachypleus tridentatus]|uniref:DGAT1/2-independent enzyme synthesizing storage lipids isoform X2 n=1 Tax=Tachypleus tridentatus TaxID=6853 RepID=UPI003FCFBD24
MEELYFYIEKLGNSTYALKTLEVIEIYVDLVFIRWLLWLFTPIVISFLLPLLIILFLQLSVLFLHIYRHRHRLRDAYGQDVWNGARQTLVTLWDAQGWIWHGYQVEGLENIPSQGGALLIYYHGALPIDYYYFVSKLLIHKRRVIRSVGDRFLFKIPGWGLLMEVFHVFTGSVQTCSQVVQEGHLVAIAPGGVLEAQFGDENYNLLWGRRTGFAKVAIQTQCPVIPVFTKNVREAFRSISIGRSWLRKLYDKTKLPVVPIYGGFPVRLRQLKLSGILFIDTKNYLETS